MTQKEQSFLVILSPPRHSAPSSVILSAAKNLKFLVGEAGGAVGEVDDAAVGEAGS